MSYFKELKCTATFVVAVPATATSDQRMVLLDKINKAVRDAVLELRRGDVNFLPLDVTTSLETTE